MVKYQYFYQYIIKGYMKICCFYERILKMKKLNEEKIRLALLGRLPIGVKVAIITPIESIFDKFCYLLSSGEVNEKCFFKNAYFQTIKGTNGIIVHIPQGRCAQDVMYAFDGIQVLFLGYAGSLYSTILVGTVLEVEMAIESEKNQYELNMISDLKRVKGGYSPCMLGDVAYQYRKLAQDEGCHIVEMEIVECAKAAGKNQNLFSAFVVISDIPGIADFWNLTDDERILFNQRKSKLIRYIVNYVEKM